MFAALQWHRMTMHAFVPTPEAPEHDPAPESRRRKRSESPATPKSGRMKWEHKPVDGYDYAKVSSSRRGSRPRVDRFPCAKIDCRAVRTVVWDSARREIVTDVIEPQHSCDAGL